MQVYKATPNLLEPFSGPGGGKGEKVWICAQYFCGNVETCDVGGLKRESLSGNTAFHWVKKSHDIGFAFHWFCPNYSRAHKYAARVSRP